MEQKKKALPPNGEALPKVSTSATVLTSGDTSFDADLLEGADEIAAFLYGSSKRRRTVYHLAEQSRLPVFRLGTVLCARRSTLTAWIAEQERRAVSGVSDA